MALTRNGSHQLTGLSRFHGAVGAYGLRSALDNNGKRKNFDSGEHAVSNVTNKAAIPEGFRHPMSWKMGTKAGSLSSHVEADLTFTPTGAMLRGYPIVGEAGFSITTNTPDGQLIVSGTGTAALQISTNNPLLTASLNGAGTASFTISVNSPILGAEASLVGEALITISTNTPAMYPLDDTSPLRTASATFAFSGSLVSYALGHMEGSTVDTSTITNESVAAAVWSALAAAYNDAGTMGEKLNGAGSAGNPWTEVIESGFTAAQILRLLAAHAAGSAANLEGSNPSFTGLDGTTTRIQATYSGGTRTINSLDGEI